MSDEITTVNRLDLPYKSLILTGFLGVGKTTIGRKVAWQLGVEFFDLEEEIELRELMSISKLRELYGDTRLRTIEYDLCRQAALMRRAVIVIPGEAMLDLRNFKALTEVGLVVCMTCELGEALRRLHLSSEQHYRDITIRRRMLSRLRRAYEITRNPQILQFDTTHLEMEEEVNLLIQHWAKDGEKVNELFYHGPRPTVSPPPKIPVGLSSPTRGTR